MKSLITIILLVFASAALAQPVQEWVARYNGPGNDHDEASALAVDGEGNIYVTGWGLGLNGEDEYATIKYDPEGNQLWVARYGRGSADHAYAVAVDAERNVYVTGESRGSNTHFDYATVKYDSNGDSVWVAFYNGPDNGHDQAVAIEVDAQGSVYVTGWSQVEWPDNDYATVKYDSEGNELWVARYNGPVGDGTDEAAALAVDADGNVYVTGASKGVGVDYDYLTVKYDSLGSEVWVVRYNGPGNHADRSHAIAVDAEGNVYITGRAVISGNYWDSDYLTIKLDSNGYYRWVAHYDGTAHSWDAALALALDDNGSVYVTGSIRNMGDHQDYATIKYDSLGNQLWVACYDGPDTNDDVASDLAVDPVGNVYVTGSSGGTVTYDDYVTIKYDPNGNELWLVRYNGPVNGTDRAVGVCVDAEGNVYVTGRSDGPGTSGDCTTIKYSQAPLVELSCQTAAPWFCRGRDFSFRLTVANNTEDDVSGTLTFAGHSGHDCDPGNVLINIPRNKTYPPGVTRQYYFLKLPRALVPGKYSISVGGTLSDYEVFCCANTRIVQCSPWKEGTNIEWELVQVSRPEFVPIVTCLARNYPNPFNATTEISYALAEAGDVTLAIYNLGGQLIKTLVDGHQDVGEYSVVWDASGQASGVYFYKLSAGDFTEVRRMTLLK